MWNLVAVLALSVVLAACGGEDGPTAPPAPVFPEVQGVYDYSAPITELPGGRFSGNFTVLDDGGTATQQFSGTFVANLVGPDGTSYATFDGPIVSGGVTEAGAISFNFMDATWNFSGQLTGRNITGTWILRGNPNYTGTFTAVRR